MTVWLSSGAFAASDLPTLLRAAGEAGARAIELASGFPDSDSLVADLDAAQNDGMQLMVHNYAPAPRVPFTLNLASPDTESRARSLDFAERNLELCARLSAPFYAVHAGFALDLPPEALGRPDLQASLFAEGQYDRAQAMDHMLIAVDRLADRAKELGTKVLIENNVVAPETLTGSPPGTTKRHPLLLADPEETEAFFAQLGRVEAGLLLDVAHAKVSGKALAFDPAGFFELKEDWLGALHLSDNDGISDYNGPIGPASWFWPYLADVHELDMVIEVYRLNPAQASSQLALVREAKRKA
ncbi:TIM barrel protein [Roseibium sp. HPY-6]|uniref:sugar phosphate isomerase/epimerase family protein n=1 Tax=Roseibium sp. HPY-6 TaxID=3229852 RepID=UPI00338D8625